MKFSVFNLNIGFMLIIAVNVLCVLSYKSRLNPSDFDVISKLEPYQGVCVFGFMVLALLHVAQSFFVNDGVPSLDI